MTDSEPIGWMLPVLGIGSTVAGAYLTGTTGDVHGLLVIGLGTTTIWLALHGDPEEDSSEHQNSDSEEST